MRAIDYLVINDGDSIDTVGACCSNDIDDGTPRQDIDRLKSDDHDGAALIHK